MIDSCPTSQDIKQLQRFLSIVNWLCPRFATSDLSLEGQPKNAAVDCRSQGDFKDAKRLLTKVVPLQHPSPQAKLSIPTSEALYSKNLVTVGAPLVFFPENCLTRNLVIPLLIESC